MYCSSVRASHTRRLHPMISSHIDLSVTGAAVVLSIEYELARGKALLQEA